MAKKTLRPIYDRDSMERFGDDLTQEVIQYLGFSDKVVLQHLCKQWQRLVFNKQTELDLNHRIFVKRSNHWFFTDEVNRQSLESFLKKRPNISRVVLRRYGLGKELDLITKYCRRVTKLEISYTVDRKQLIEFGHKHGHWLEEFVIQNILALNDDLKEFLRMCPNIKKTKLYDGWSVSMSKTPDVKLFEPLNKLEVIGDIWVTDDRASYYRLQLFVAKYAKCLKEVRFHLHQWTSNDLKSCLTLISRFESLESFGIEISGKENEVKSIDECLKHMTRLKHLSITCEKLKTSRNQDLFANIPTHLPNLRNLDIKVPHISKDSIKQFVESLQTMKYIERVVINWQTFFYCKNRSQSKPRILFR